MTLSVEPAAVGGVMAREWVMYRRYWTSTTVASVVEPVMYLLAFGFGFGALVSTVGGYDYVEFVGTGVVATSILFSSAFAGMFSTFVKRTYQHTYDAMLAAPVDTQDLVTAEALFLALKAGAYGLAPLGVAVAFGLAPSPGMLLVPVIGVLAGFGWACFGIWISSLVPSINSFDYIISCLLTPVFLVAGTFFPIDGLPGWAQAAAQLNPLYHCVELVRHAVFGLEPLADLAHVGVLAAFAGLSWVLAVRALRACLVQ
ncbi:MAG TPA: ABC transporter permease [Mycobacteriales bacterium]|nr:ABC transporter permease [Mycobacteriales bacterium]